MLISFVKEYPFILAFLLGFIPALVWLWFWLREDIHHEPSKMLTLSFLGGMFAVLIVLPLQEYLYPLIREHLNSTIWAFAAMEEAVKFILIYFIALRNKNLADEPVDDIIYLIVGALGFSTLENTFYLVNPIQNGDLIGSIVHGNLRFMGASLLHIISSSTIGVFMALSFYKSKMSRLKYLLIGFFAATALHTAFNLLIINELQKNIFFIFGVVWFAIIILLLLFEKIKRIVPKQTIKKV